MCELQGPAGLPSPMADAEVRSGGNPRPSDKWLVTGADAEEEPSRWLRDWPSCTGQLNTVVFPSGLPTKVDDVPRSVSIGLAVDLEHRKGLLLRYKNSEDRCVC